MKRLFILLAGFALWRIAPAYAQFMVTASSPADGAANVPLVTTVSFTFNAPLDTAARFQEGSPAPLAFLGVGPEDSLVFGAISYSPDLTTISVEVTHTANTDFVWILTGARSMSGLALTQPYVLNYTTSSSHGERTVSGAIRYDAGDPINTIVALQDRPLFSEEDGIVKVATFMSILSSFNGYLCKYVRDGVYWPVAVKDIDGDGLINPEGSDMIGYYDPNNDGQPDSIVVSGSNLMGIDMALRQLFVYVTAKSYLDTAAVIAHQYAPDQELRAIIAHDDTLRLDGTSVFWMYQFYSPSLQFPTRVLVSSLFIQIDTTRAGEPNLPSNMRPIPENFVDSDMAMAIAEANGGSDFRAQHNVVKRSISAGNLFWILPQDSTKIFWLVQYEASDAGNPSPLFFRAYVDMVTGELITGVQEPVHSAPMGFALYQNYPNPFNPETVISYQLPVTSNVDLSVYNLLGQKVATVVAGKQSAGMHRYVWEAKGLASGVYLYRLQAGEFVQTKKFLLLR